jgi:hypothetical protein
MVLSRKMEKREMDKSETRTVSLPLTLWTEVENRARENFGGKRSSYIKALVSGDLGPRRNVCQIGENIILDLVNHYRPALLDQAREHMAGINQQMFLDKIIEQVNAFMRSPGEHSPSNVVIISKELYVELLKSCGREKMERIADKWTGLSDYEVPLGEMLETENPETVPKPAAASGEEPSRRPHKFKHRAE